MKIVNRNIPVIQKQVLIVVMVLALTSCKKLVETDPPSSSITDAAVFRTDATAIAVLTGQYSIMNFSPIQGSTGMSVLGGLSADELSLYSGVTSATYVGYYTNTLSQRVGASLTGTDSWYQLYNFIYTCNSALQWLEAGNSLTPAVKQQLIGESNFLRAFCYFYLVNLFGDVPMPLTTDPEVNRLLYRSPKADVYSQIITDLKEAEANLSENYLSGTLSNSTERVRPTKWAATALLSRVYLYLGEWAKAEEKVTALIDNKALFDLLPLNNVFLKNSKEAIWQLQPTATNFNTVDAQTLVIPQTGPNTGTNPVFLSDTLLNSFEPGDLRKVFGNWVDTTIYTISLSPLVRDTVAYCYKYKVNTSPGVTTTAGMTEYFMVLRLGEQYLIRAEARAQLGNIGGAQSDLNAIRNRAGLANTTASSQTSLLAAILHERQVELFVELGHRWLDLKRTGNVDAVMKGITPLKANGSPWQSYQQLYPLPLEDLQKDLNLVQNPEYN